MLNRHAIKWLLCLLPLAALAGCAAKDVIVHDAHGGPIPQASVTPMYPATIGTTVYTDAEGKARLGKVAGKPTWLSVAKPGYNDRTIRWPGSWPLAITLAAKEGQPETSVPPASTSPVPASAPTAAEPPAPPDVDVRPDH